ncbi:MAG: hypothetical protein WA896_08375 [Spirulinaceae cyanobacterium]
MFQILYYLVHTLGPFFKPIGFLFVWLFLLILAWSLFSAVRDTITRAKEMHQVPCSNCQFFTNDYRLKCTIKPNIANTEQAIDCSDYHLNQTPLMQAIKKLEEKL